jgi:hypothetical protein
MRRAENEVKRKKHPMLQGHLPVENMSRNTYRKMSRGLIENEGCGNTKPLRNGDRVESKDACGQRKKMGGLLARL